MGQTRSEKILSTAAMHPGHEGLALRAVREGWSFSLYQKSLLEVMSPTRTSAFESHGRRSTAWLESAGDLWALQLLGDIPGRGAEKERRIRAAEMVGAEIDVAGRGLLAGLAEATDYSKGTADLSYRAFGPRSDFPLVTSSAFSVLLESAYQGEAKPWEEFVTVVPAANFLTGHIVRADVPALTATGDLIPVPTPTPAEADSAFALTQYATGIDLGRRLLIDDSPAALKSAAEAVATASARTVANVIFASIVANPTMTDGNAVFSSAHSNSGAAPQDATGLATTMARIRNQLSLSGEAMNLIPTHVLCAPAAEGTFLGILGTYPQPADLNLLVDRRVSPSTTYFCIASGAPGLGIAALGGNLRPSVERIIQVSMGMRILVTLDIAPVWIDFRPWSRSTA